MTIQKHKPNHKRKRDTHTAYQFIQERHSVILEIYRFHHIPKRHRLTAATYARFVMVANSDRRRYHIRIQTADFVSWEMNRELIACTHGSFSPCIHGCNPNGLADKGIQP